MEPQAFREAVRAFSSGVLPVTCAFTATAVWLMCRPRAITEASWVREDSQRNSRVPAHRVAVRVLFLVAALAGMSIGSAVLSGVLREPRFMGLMIWFGVAVFAVVGVFILVSVVIGVLRLTPRTRTAINPLYVVAEDDDEVAAERKEAQLFIFALVAISLLVVGIVIL